MASLSLFFYNAPFSSEFFCCRLQELIPSVAAKDNVTHLDIILEAIRYIDSLQDKLADKIERGEIVPLQVAGKRKRGEE